MIKKPVKGILMGLLLWVIGFILGSIIMFVVNEDMIGVILFFIMPIVTFLIAWWYLRNNSEASVGIKLGIIWVAINIILDILVLVLAFGSGFSYFASWTIWAGYIEMLLVPLVAEKVLVSKLKKENKEK